LAAVVLLILIAGIFIPSKNEPAVAAKIPENTPTGEPENPDLRMRVGRAIGLDQAGKFVEAQEEYREAVRLYPDDPVALNNLAWSLAANPRPELRNSQEAVRLARRAVELSDDQQATFIGTLAAAYAEDGQFNQAIETAERAHYIALLTGRPKVAAQNEQLIKLYSAGKTVGSMNAPLPK